MVKLLIKIFIFFFPEILHAQNSSDTLQKNAPTNNADDPSQFLTRIEVFNELQRYDKKYRPPTSRLQVYLPAKSPKIPALGVSHIFILGRGACVKRLRKFMDKPPFI